MAQKEVEIVGRRIECGEIVEDELEIKMCCPKERIGFAGLYSQERTIRARTAELLRDLDLNRYQSFLTAYLRRCANRLPPAEVAQDWSNDRSGFRGPRIDVPGAFVVADIVFLPNPMIGFVNNFQLQYDLLLYVCTFIHLLAKIS
jgi:hypothetical protein